jgi:hydroxymethylpyrimidine pyrophosphatase-like HAD family hydrolase
MIKAVIADVDGVMVGKQEGVNFPLPHKDVIEVLKQVSNNGIPIVLCTAKFRRAVDGIITAAQLSNPHITDGGALIINPLDGNKIIQEHTLDDAVVREYLAQTQLYTEVYSADNYYIRKDADPELLEKRLKLLQAKPIFVDDLFEVISSVPVIKIMSIAKDDSERIVIEDRLKQLGPRVNAIWSQHPYLVPWRFTIITAPNVSKDTGAVEVAEHLNISLDEILAIGDQPADWVFMKLCGYVATIGNNKDLEKLAATKDQHYLGRSVDDNSIIAAFQYFGII